MVWLIANTVALGGGSAKPVWLVSNGFHTSLAFRARDLPFARQITGDRQADILLIGWGARDFYEGKVDPWTLTKAIFGIGGSILHVVPVRGPIWKRFSNSNVIELTLPEKNFRRVIGAIDQSFARDASHHRIFIKTGYYPDSRFYAGSERTYFPKMCNMWVAEKLRLGGEPICVPDSIMASGLTRQAKKLGLREQRLRRPQDAF